MIGLSAVAADALDENVVYVHSAGFLLSVALLKSKTGMITPFNPKSFPFVYIKYMLSLHRFQPFARGLHLKLKITKPNEVSA
jgi:hypothetical protein